MKYVLNIVLCVFLISCASQTKVYTPGLIVAMEAATKYNPISIEEDREYGGIIYIKEDGVKGYTVYRGEASSGSVDIFLTIPEGGRRLAFWHTHGSPGALRSYYSPDDGRLVKKYKVPFYMADPKGRLWILNKRHSSISRIKGHYVGDLK